jgi:hypothetical protein
MLAFDPWNLIVGIITQIETFFGYSLSLSAINTNIQNLINGILTRIQTWRITLTTLSIITVLIALKDYLHNTIFSILSIPGCLLEEILFNYLGRIFTNFFMYTFIWLFIDAFTLDDAGPCLLWWIIYIAGNLFYFIFHMIFSKFIKIDIFQYVYDAFKGIDCMNLTDGLIFLTKIPDYAVDKCFTTPDPYWFGFIQFSTCSDNYVSFKDFESIDHSAAKLHQWDMETDC